MTAANLGNAGKERRPLTDAGAHAAEKIRPGPVRRSPDGGRTAESAVHGEAAVFYGRMFHWYGWGSLLLPALAALLPALVFALGSGWLLGQIRPWLVYVWMAAPFLLAALPLPEALSLWNGSFFTAYPLTLGPLDPAFALPAPVLAAQLILLAAGVGGVRAKLNLSLIHLLKKVKHNFPPHPPTPHPSFHSSENEKKFLIICAKIRRVPLAISVERRIMKMHNRLGRRRRKLPPLPGKDEEEER